MNKRLTREDFEFEHQYSEYLENYINDLECSIDTKVCEEVHKRCIYDEKIGSITVWEMIEKWDRLKDTIECTILSIHECAKDPNSEFVIITTGTLGGVLNTMKKMEEKDNE